MTENVPPHWNQHARGVFFSLGLEHDARHLSRAVLEGVAFSFRGLASAAAGISFEVEEIQASGGITHSPPWLQVMADVLGRPIALPPWGETAAIRAAFWALLGAGELEKIEDSTVMAKLKDTCQPNPALQNLYHDHHKKFESLYQALKSSFISK